VFNIKVANAEGKCINVVRDGKTGETSKLPPLLSEERLRYYLVTPDAGLR
jgi:hypothetical protein